MESIDTRVSINAYFILESLEDDRTTMAIGRLINSLIDKESTNFYYVKIKNKQELVNVIRKITEAENVYPLVHIAAHGNKSGTGIKLIEEEIEWPELTKELSDMNIRTKNNSILIMALCKGAHIAKLFENTKRAPYFVMLGPVDEINWDKLDRYLFEMYKILIPTSNFHEALAKLRDLNGGVPPFYYLNCVGQYQKSIEKIKGYIGNGKMRHKLLDSYRKMEGKKADSEFKYKIADIEYQKKILSEACEVLKNHWFMIDLYEENRERFKDLNTTIE